MTARQNPVLPLFFGDQHLTTVIPCSHRAWPEEWAEPIEKLLEKQADMRAAGVRVQSEGSTSSLTGTVSPATNRSLPVSRKSVPQSSKRRAKVILPISRWFDDSSATVSRQDELERSIQSKSEAQTVKSMFGRSITEASSETGATANTSARAHSCLTSDEIPDFLAAARDPGGDEHRWTCRMCHHILSAATSRKLTIARSNHLTRGYRGATGDRVLWIRNGIDVFEVTLRKSSMRGPALCVWSGQTCRCPEAC